MYKVVQVTNEIMDSFLAQPRVHETAEALRGHEVRPRQELLALQVVPSYLHPQPGAPHQNPAI